MPGIAGQFGRLLAPVRDRLQYAGLTAFPVTVLLSVAVVVVWLLANQPATAPLIRRCCDLSAGQPLWVALARLPGSLVAPTPHLPVTGAVLQVLAVIGLAEAALGARRTVAVAFLGHAAATLAARVAIRVPLVDPHTAAQLLHLTDTGPSAAVVALAAAVSVGRRAPVVFGAVGAAMLAEVWLQPSLAGFEHLVALVIGAAAGVALRGGRLRLALAVPARLRYAAALAAFGSLVGWHSYHPLAAGPRTSPRAVALANRAALPVEVTPPAGGYLSSRPDCRPRLRGSQWLWRRPLWLCGAPAHGAVVVYRWAGVRQTWRS